MQESNSCWSQQPYSAARSRLLTCSSVVQVSNSCLSQQPYSAAKSRLLTCSSVVQELFTAALTVQPDPDCTAADRWCSNAAAAGCSSPTVQPDPDCSAAARWCSNGAAAGRSGPTVQPDPDCSATAWWCRSGAAAGHSSPDSAARSRRLSCGCGAGTEQLLVAAALRYSQIQTVQLRLGGARTEQLGCCVRGHIIIRIQVKDMGALCIC